MFRRLTSAVLGMAALTALATTTGCKADDTIAASDAVTADTLVAYAMTGTPADYPSALAPVSRTTVRIADVPDFDVAFDFVNLVQIKVIPVRLIISPFLGAHQVGLLAQTGVNFDDITRAPNGYYRPDTAITVNTGEPFVILSTRGAPTQTCAYIPTPHIYTKVVIDSIRPATTRAIYLRQVVDPNCGFRSLVPGLPTN